MGKKRKAFFVFWGYSGRREQEVTPFGMDRNTLAEQVLDTLQKIAMTDVTELVQVENGQLVVHDTAALDPACRAAIASIEKTAGSIKVKFYDRLKALELLGKYLSLFDGQAPAGKEDSTLLQEIINSTKEVIDTYDLPEIQQTAVAGHDLVESAGA